MAMMQQMMGGGGMPGMGGGMGRGMTKPPGMGGKGMRMRKR